MGEAEWGFYGRQSELGQLREILGAPRHTPETRAAAHARGYLAEDLVDLTRDL